MAYAHHIEKLSLVALRRHTHASSWHGIPLNFWKAISTFGYLPSTINTTPTFGWHYTSPMNSSDLNTWWYIGFLQIFFEFDWSMMEFVDGFQPILGCGHCHTDREQMCHLVADEQQNSDWENIPLPPHALCRPHKSTQSTTLIFSVLRKSWTKMMVTFFESSNESKSSVTSSESGDESDGFEFIGNTEVCPGVSWECLNWCPVFFSLQTAFLPKWSLLTGKCKESVAVVSLNATSSKQHCATVEDVEDNDMDIPGLTPLSGSSSMASLVSTTSVSSLASMNVAHTNDCTVSP